MVAHWTLNSGRTREKNGQDDGINLNKPTQKEEKKLEGREGGGDAYAVSHRLDRPRAKKRKLGLNLDPAIYLSLMEKFFLKEKYLDKYN